MFNRILRNSNGYMLLVTFGIIILFSVLGLSLMNLTISGTAKNSTREDITQSLNLAEKGQDFIINDINTSLAKFTEDGKSRDEFLEELEKYDHNNPTYKCTFDSRGNLTGGMEIKRKFNENDTSIACIKNVHPVIEDGELNELKRTLELVSFGMVDGQRKQLTTFVEIGADNVPEQLKYALTSKGNIHLNGAVQITGDIKFNGNLTTYDKSHIINGSHFWVDSLKPSLKSTSSRSNPRIVVSKNSGFYHVQDLYNNSQRYSYIHSMNSNVLTRESEDISNLFDTTVFDKKPTVIVTDTLINDVDITSKKETYKYNRNSASVTDLTIRNSRKVPPNKYTNKRFLVYNEYEKCNWWEIFCRDKDNYYTDGTFLLEGEYTFDSLATSGNLSITSSGNNTTKVTIKDTLYVDGNLNIEGNVELNGSIFVNGRLVIRNSNLKTNALMYVNNPNSSDNYEPVDIQYSTINSLPYKNANGEDAKGTLVIFSKGTVKLSNNSTWDDKPSEIFGYFYSDKELEIYGSGSNMKIHGGLYGRRITLHGIRGRADGSKFTNSNSYNGWYFLTSSLQDNTVIKNANENTHLSCNFPDKKTSKKKCYEYNSRLQILYNEDIVSTYIELNREEELIYKVESPNIKERN